MREYEIMLIVDPDADDQQVDAVLQRVTEILAGRGGEVGKVDRWGRRKLAYEIDRKSEGQYAVIVFKADPEAVDELERVLSLADEVLRHKVVVRAA